MLARLRHRLVRHVVDATAKPAADPTGTSDIRRRFTTQTDIRWRRFTAAVRSVILEQDILGLQPNKNTPLGIAMQAIAPDGRQRSFQTWTDATLNRIVLENDTAYLDPMIAATYRRATIRAQRLSRVGTPPSMQDVIFNLQQLTLTEMQGVVEAVSQRLVRLAAQAMLDNVSVRDILALMQDAVSKIGMKRSRDVVAVMVIKTHSQATLDTFEFAGVRRVGLVPETVRPLRIGDARRRGPGSRVSREDTPSASTIGRIERMEREVAARFRAQEVEVQTAGDDLVCPQCEEISADGPYEIDQARGLIPAHPNCRCSFVPVGELEL